MMGYGYGMMGGWMFMMIIPLLLIGIIVYAAVKLASGSQSNYAGKYGETNRAMEILNQRFANGEISEEEYKKKKDMLKY
ncbi:MAG: putative rane protein [Petroclostridium sp.]|uniref:SHOCT domain-containing protein n=1 Tax=Petroclostridium xylanilyticum TaxID=1792311 RepID=UPI000B97CEFC|nr:SHOCT domain-containing protein [Petroclostridium xylanilyticum]MDK2809460.1 putative rane protein [Petroclostridium sp.]